MAHERTRAPGRDQTENRAPTPVWDEAAQPRDTKVQLSGQGGTRETDAAAQEQLQRNAQDAKRAAQADSQRQANDARVKAQADSRAKARDAQSEADVKVQQRNQDLEKFDGASHPSLTTLARVHSKYFRVFQKPVKPIFHFPSGFSRKSA